MNNNPIGSWIWTRKGKDAPINGDKETPSEISTSTSGIGEEFEYVRNNSSLLSLQPWIFRKRDGGGARVDRNQCSLERRRLRDRSHLEPLGYNEHVEIGEYLLSSPPNSPVPAFRPFCVSGGERSNGQSRFDSLIVNEKNDGIGCGGGVDLGLKGGLVSMPPLSGVRSSVRKSMEVESVRFGSSGSQSSWKSSHSEGLVDRILHFCLGISIGMLSTTLLNRVEVQKLNKLLKHNEDLVQDLQEEMEMRDSLSVKQLTNVSCEKQLQFDAEESIGLWENENPSSNLTMDKKKEDDHPHLHKESLSKIAAELEVELERLEQTINASDEEQRISDLSELDPDLLCEVVHGELLVTNLTSELANSTSELGTTSTAQTYNANYSVSPKELSIRLHEVIQTRLEERIEELEGELLQRQNHRKSSQRTFSNSDIDFSSNQESPRWIQSDGALAPPFLLGDTLNAYEEAYEELFPVVCEEKPQPSIDKSTWIEGCGSNSSSISPLWENVLWSRESNDTPKKDEEDSESDYFDDDEEAKLLIQQILERKRQGSPVFVNAQKIFSSLDYLDE